MKRKKMKKEEEVVDEEEEEQDEGEEQDHQAVGFHQKSCQMKKRRPRCLPWQSLLE